MAGLKSGLAHVWYEFTDLFIKDGNGAEIPVVSIGGAPGDLTAFGDLPVAIRTAHVQIKYPHGINTLTAQALTNGAGSNVTTLQGTATITCEGDAEKFSQIRSQDVILYEPGQGGLGLFTASFTAGVALSSQVAGIGDDDEGLFFGYDETEFGILRRAHGQLEVKSLEITGGADVDGGDFVITLDGSPVTITVAASATIADVVFAVTSETQAFLDAGRGWEVSTEDSATLRFISLVAEPAAGAFTFADTDSGVTANAFATDVLGVVPDIEEWVAQADWNRDTFDGNPETSPSGVTLDPSKLNVFRIRYQYLGAGSIQFSIEEPITGKFRVVHEIEYANANTIASLTDPAMPMTLIAKTEAGYVGPDLLMANASMGGYTEGQERGDLLPRYSTDNEITTNALTLTNVLTVANPFVFKNARNKINIVPDLLTISSEAIKTVTFVLVRNPDTIEGSPVMVPVSPNSPILVDKVGTDVAGGDAFAIFHLVGAGQAIVPLDQLQLRLRPGERWTVAVTLNGGSDAEATVGLTWAERV